LKEKVGLALGIFCAGAPSTAGILSLLAKLGLDRQEVKDIRFRGMGWPGSFSVQRQDCDDVACRMSYGESWGFLQAYRPFRCHLCPDGTSEFADISCGDPWYREPAAGDPGRSLILVRTQRGREILKAAAEAGFLYMERVEPAVLESSQINLLMKRRAIWGRLIAMKGFGLPVPTYNGFPLFQNWLELPWLERIRSVMGTARRILQRKYFKMDIDLR
jgi:coenzyme F420 hydrogenase subunit beta